jgi:hypothetical protein
VNQEGGLMAAFEEQRLVKRALVQLPEFEEPRYMSTRVLARIEAQRGKRASGLLGRLRLAAGGAVLFVGGFVAALQFMQPTLNNARVMAERGNPAPLVTEVGLMQPTDDMFSRLPDMGGLLTAEEREQLSPEAVAYLETLKQAHSESLLQNINRSQSPGLSDAVLVLDISGN